MSAGAHRAPRSRAPRGWLLAGVLVLVVAVIAAVVAAWPGGDDGPTTATPRTPTASPPGAASPTPEQPDPSTPTGWGPTLGEVETAQELVAGWTAEQLAGQVIVGRYAGTDPAVPAQLTADLHLAGVSVTKGNVVDADQVRATTQAVSAAVAADGRDFPAVIGVDQEGGSVEHLRGIATEFPAFVYAGATIANDPDGGPEVVTEAAEATGLELRDFGFTWVFAPVADVTIGAADPTIGSRSPSTDPSIAARSVTAAVTGFDRAGIVSTVKHFPGHGAVTDDSHEVLPVQEEPLETLRERDLPPFEAAVEAGAPAVMMAHLDVSAVAPGVPSSQAPPVYRLLREEVGFEGVAITDSLGMGAALSQDFPAVRALQAGADLLLMPVDTRTTHRLVTEAIEDGRVPRARAEEAAARVVAVQLWQQRVARAVPVPEDATARAQAAAAALVAGD